MIGASTWPGGGTNAGSGWMLAGELIDGGGVAKWVLGGAAVAGLAAVATAFAGRDGGDDRGERGAPRDERS